MYKFVNTFNIFLTIDLGGLYGYDWHYVGLGYVSTVEAVGRAYFMRMEIFIKY